jgi:four helix bundle protein
MANYRDSDAWKLAMELVCDIYRATVKFPDEETFGLTAQMRSGAIRGTSKIAEGMLDEARWSLLEVETQIIVAARLGYLTKQAARALYKLARAAAKALDAITPCRISPGTA